MSARHCERSATKEWVESERRPVILQTRQGNEMSALISGLIGAVVAVGLATLVQRRQKSAMTDGEGWKTLRSSWLLNGTFVACVAFTALISYFLLSGGSSRADAQAQNLYALALAIVFGLGAIYLGWTTYGRTIAWNDRELRVRTVAGRESVRSISDVQSIRKSDAHGDYRITFRDGSKLVFSAYMHGANELVAALPQNAIHPARR